MRSRASQVIIGLVLLTCLVCPLVESFDHWDHTLQTGNDTEYALVVLALCVGVVYSVARFISVVPLLGFVAKSFLKLGRHKSLPFTPFGVPLLLFSAISPPTLALRI